MKKSTMIFLSAILLTASAAFGQFKHHRSYNIDFSQFHFAPKLQNIALPTGVSLQYAEQGLPGNTTVIFLHGFTDSWLSFRSVMEELPPTIHCIALTQRGHGESQHPDSGYRVKDFSDDVAGLVSALNLGKVIVVGHSMGGLIAQRFAIDHPQMVKGVMLLGTSANFSKKELKEFATVVDGFTDKLPDGFVREFQGSTVARTMDPLYFDELVKESEKLPLFVWKQVLHNLVIENLSREVRRIRSRVRIIWGTKDIFCSREDQEELKGSMPNADLLVVDGAGHAVHWEQPGVVATEIIAFNYFLRKK